MLSKLFVHASQIYYCFEYFQFILLPTEPLKYLLNILKIGIYYDNNNLY